MPRVGLFLSLALLLPGAALAHPAIGVVEDSRGNVYYTDLAQVWKIAPDGTMTRAVSGVHTHELYLDADDNLFGQHLWYEGDATKKWGHRVWKLSKDGKLEDVIPPREGFLENYSFVRDGAGNMYWAGGGEGDASPRRTIQKRTPDGKVTTLVGMDAGLTNVRWLVSTRDGVLYAFDLDSVKKISRDGRVTTLASDIEGMGLWPDVDGSVYVTNLPHEAVERIMPDGKVTVVTKSRGSWAPTGVSVAANGDLLILESSGARARVRRVKKDGSNERLYEGKLR